MADIEGRVATEKRLYLVNVELRERLESNRLRIEDMGNAIASLQEGLRHERSERERLGKIEEDSQQLLAQLHDAENRAADSTTWLKSMVAERHNLETADTFWDANFLRFQFRHWRRQTGAHKAWSAKSKSAAGSNR